MLIGLAANVRRVDATRACPVGNIRVLALAVGGAK